MGGCDDPRLFRPSWRAAVLLPLLLLSAALGRAQPQRGPSLVSSFSTPRTTLRPFDWQYLRFEVPPSFASVVLTFESDVDIDTGHIKDFPWSKLPVMCFRGGSPPLPDVSDVYLNDSLLNLHFNGSFGASQNLSVLDKCIPFQSNITLTWTTEQISPGIWYIGFFNGLGPARTQSKMINRGQAFKFGTQINVKECTTSTLLGPYCNRTIDILSCSQYAVSGHARNLIDVKAFDNSRNYSQLMGSGANDSSLPNLNTVEEKQVLSNSSMSSSAESFISCNNSIYSSCLGYGEVKFYFLDILNMIPQFNIVATELRLSQASSINNPTNFNGTALMCYARYNGMPDGTLYDHSADISKGFLIVKSPKIGRWYIAVQAVYHAKVNGGLREANSQANLCFSFGWQVHECLNGKAGLSCTWESYMLQRILGKGSAVPFDSYYVPSDENGPMEKEFPLEKFLSNSSIDDVSWTYFFVNVPPGTAGTMHVLLRSDMELNYELYSKYEGLPSLDTWDYHVNSTTSSNGSLLVSDENGADKIDFYILYANEGTWCFGLKHAPDSRDKYQTAMSIALEGCPRHCSSNGKCQFSMDQSGMAFYSYCSCDRDHGGFDCSDELVSHEGHIWHSIFLIASNGAAIFPAFWALRRKAFAEWVLFTSSGISSGLYHACDVGTWCVLSFPVLQFMDFWLSFMAVVSTFVFMATIDEVSKRAIHTCVAIFTALLALTNATRSANIAIVLAIGFLALLIAWMLEFSSTIRSLFSAQGFDLNVHESWEGIKRWFFNLVKTLQKRFHWGFILLGLIALAAAGVSWKLENSENYWIWHSLWHITIYTSSFFFLFSTSPKSNNEHQDPLYELTRQNSGSRIY